MRKRSYLINRKKIILYQYNTRPHTALANRKNIVDLNWEMLPRPAYSPDLAQSDFHLFRFLQKPLNGQNFKNEIDVTQVLFAFFDSKDQALYKNEIKIYSHFGKMSPVTVDLILMNDF